MSASPSDILQAYRNHGHPLQEKQMTHDEMLSAPPEPHSEEWFAKLDELSPPQATMTRRTLELAGRKDVCGQCGDAPAADYKVTHEDGQVVAIPIRLCDDCRLIRADMYKESYTPMTPGA
jgi:hypothetical protein